MSKIVYLLNILC